MQHVLEFLHLSLETVIQIQWHKNSFAFITVAKEAWNIWDILININYEKKTPLFSVWVVQALFIYLCHSLFAIFIVVICENPFRSFFMLSSFFFFWNIRRNTCSLKDSTRLERTVNLKLGRGKRNLHISNDGSSKWNNKFRFSCLSEENSQFVVA